MTLNVTSPSLYALGTVTTIISFAIIVACTRHHRPTTSGAACRAPATGRISMESASGDIELAGVVKTFDGFINAVDGVNLNIPDGAYCCFLGPRAAARPRSCG